MDKFLIFADIHIHPHGGDWARVQDCINVMKWILEEAKKREIKKIFFLGDFFHSREKVYSIIMSQATDILKTFEDAGIQLYLLVGNHDMPLKNTTNYNVLRVYHNFKNVCIVDKPTAVEMEDCQIILLPYIEDMEKLGWAIKEVEKQKHPTKKNYLFGHLDLIKAWYNNYRASEYGIDPDSIQGWDIVISGHYHSFQKVKENIWYVGSPLELNFGDANTTKGFIAYTDGVWDFIENTFSPKFMHIDPSMIGEAIRDNYVTINIRELDKVDEYRSKALEFKPRRVEVNLISEAKTGEGLSSLGSFDVKKNLDTLMKFWVDTYAPEIYDKEKLLKVGNEIIQKTQANEA